MKQQPKYKSRKKPIHHTHKFKHELCCVCDAEPTHIILTQLYCDSCFKQMFGRGK